MATSALAYDDVPTQAAALTFALIRFEEVAAHPARGSTSKGAPKPGIDAYVFMPSAHRVPRSEVVGFLAGLPSPALLSLTTTRGLIVLTLLSELSGDRRAGMLHGLDNQRAVLEDMVGKARLPNDARVILGFGKEEHLIPLAVVRWWSEHVGVTVGWSVVSSSDDPRAAARMLLYRSDGGQSLGGPRDASPPNPLQPRNAR